MRLIVDLDGVLANFHLAVCQIFDRLDLIEHWPFGQSWMPDVLGVTEEEFWNRLPNDFFQMLPLCDDADILLEGIKVLDPAFYVCTSPGPTAWAATFKINWMRTYLGDNFKRYVIVDDKTWLANAEHLLIDDFDKNVDAFIKAGGKAVLVPRPWNSRWQESDISAKIVLDTCTEHICRY